MLSMEALSQFNEYKFFRIRNGYGESSANKTLPWVPKTLRHEVAMGNPTQLFFYQFRFKNGSFISERDLAM